MLQKQKQKRKKKNQSATIFFLSQQYAKIDTCDFANFIAKKKEKNENDKIIYNELEVKDTDAREGSHNLHVSVNRFRHFGTKDASFDNLS